MNPKEIDFAYALDFLKKVNKLTLTGKEVKNSFFFNEYNLWQAYQQMLFEDIKHFSYTKRYAGATRSMSTIFKDTVLKTFIVFSSACAVLKGMIFPSMYGVYTVDVLSYNKSADARLSEVYQVLEKNKKSFFEIIHTTIGRRFLANFFIRKRISFYHESVFILAALLALFKKEEALQVGGLDHFETNDERRFALQLLVTYKRRALLSNYALPCLCFIFKRVGLKKIFLIDDGRYYLEVLLAAKMESIQSVAIQHGHYTKYHVGWLALGGGEGKMIAPDTLLVWSLYWKKELLRLGTFIKKENICLGGFKEGFDTENVKDEGSEAPLRLLIPYETSAPKKNISEIIKRVLESKYGVVIFKIRKDMSKVGQLVQYGLEEYKGGNLIVTEDTNEALKDATVLIGVYSTFLYEGVTRKIPVGVLLDDSDYGEGMVYNRLASRVTIKKDILSQLNELLTAPHSVLSERQETLVGKERVSLKDILASYL